MTTTTTTWGRHYPVSCRSINCGETQCPASCPDLPALQEFNTWKRSHRAYQPDPVWSPSYWEAWDDGMPTTAELIGWGKPYRATRATGVDGQRY